MPKESFSVLVSVQISQTNGALLEDSPLSLLFCRFPKGVFWGFEVRTVTSSFSSSERLMRLGVRGAWGMPRDAAIARWRSLSSAYCSTEMAVDLLVPLLERGVKMKASTSITSFEGEMEALILCFLFDPVWGLSGVLRLISDGGGDGGGSSGLNFRN